MTTDATRQIRVLLLTLLICAGLLFWALHTGQFPALLHPGYVIPHSHLMGCPPPPFEC